MFIQVLVKFILQLKLILFLLNAKSTFSIQFKFLNLIFIYFCCFISISENVFDNDANTD